MAACWGRFGQTERRDPSGGGNFGVIPESVAAGCVVALFGPTGVGKTAVAVEVAARLSVRVISADSMQLYRGFPVLTNQPLASERGRAQHALVEVADPEEEWTVAEYAREVRRALDQNLTAQGWAVIAGGTGLYLRAALAPLDIPAVHDPELRRRLERQIQEEGVGALYEELSQLDPEAAARVDAQNPRRVTRALEVVLTEGPGSWSGRGDLWNPRYRHPTAVFGLNMPRELLYERINQRTRHLLEGGAVEEVHRYLARRADTTGSRAAGGAEATGSAMPAEPVTRESGIFQAIGFREIRRHLAGEITEEQLIERVAASTRRYARAQLTWLRKLPDVVMMDPSGRPPDEVADEIVALAKRRCGKET